MAVIMKNEKIIWDALIKAGYREIEAAGILGNLYEESGYNPINLQWIYEKILHMTDEEYTEAINSGIYSYKQFYSDHAGYGLVQWTWWGRKQAMYNACYPEIGSLDKQIRYMIKELAGYTHVQVMLRKASTIRECSDIILHYYEQPGDQSTATEERRARYGEEAYSRCHTPEPQPVKGWWVCQCAAYKTQNGACNAAAKINGNVYRSHTAGYFAVALGQYDSEAEAKKHLPEAQKQRKDAFVTYYKKEDLIQ